MALRLLRKESQYINGSNREVLRSVEHRVLCSVELVAKKKAHLGVEAPGGRFVLMWFPT